MTAAMLTTEVVLILGEAAARVTVSLESDRDADSGEVTGLHFFDTAFLTGFQRKSVYCTGAHEKGKVTSTNLSGGIAKPAVSLD